MPDRAGEIAAEQPYPLIFATVSGAHLYGFACVDSDLDLRDAHVLSAADVLGLRTGRETRQAGGWRHGVEGRGPRRAGAGRTPAAGRAGGRPRRVAPARRAPAGLGPGPASPGPAGRLPDHADRNR